MAGLRIVVLALAAIVASCAASCPRDCICGNLYSKCYQKQRVPTDIPTGVKRLQLYYHGQVQANAFAYLWQLTHLKFVKTQLLNVDAAAFNGLGTLETLDLTSTKLTTMVFERIHLQSLSSLQTLKMSFNKLTLIPKDSFANLGTMKQLRLSHNEIEELTPGTLQPLHHIQSIDLAGNKLQRIENNTFEGLKDLLRLYLSENRITSLSPDVFRGLLSVVSIDLSFNEITVVYPGTFDGLPKLNYVTIANNRLVNDYKLCALVSTLKTRFTVDFDTGSFMKANAVPTCGQPCSALNMNLRCKDCTGTVAHHTCADDINECTTGTHQCSRNSKCVNTPDTYHCDCDAHFTGETCTYWYGGNNEFTPGRDWCTVSEFFVVLPHFSIYHDETGRENASAACQSFGLSLPTRRAEHCFYDTGFRRFFSTVATSKKSLFFHHSSELGYARKLSNGMDSFHMQHAQYLCFANWKTNGLVQRVCDGVRYTIPKRSMLPLDSVCTWAVAERLCEGRMVPTAQLSSCLTDFVRSANVLFGVKSSKTWTSEEQASIDVLSRHVNQESTSLYLLPICAGRV